MARVFNFSAGPAALPLAVLEQARAEMLEYQDSGMSVMEMTHRGKHFSAIHASAMALIRELMGVPDDYAVLLMQGGASSQFAFIPMNLVTDRNQTIDVVHTGMWSKKAIAEGRKFANVQVIASSEEANFSYIPAQSEWTPTPGAAYRHITSNNTIFGAEYHWQPEAGDAPLVADMSSNILSRPVDVSRYGLIYAGAQKNLGPSGVTLVVVRKELLGRNPDLPQMFDFSVQAEKDSMLNTPPTYAIYILKLVLEWVKAQGGVAALEQRNIAKADKLYAAIDASGLYSCPTRVDSRSRMNIPFTLADDALNAPFLAEAEAAGLVNLKGHRSVGGMRASIYNAMEMAGVDALVDFMADFEKRHG
ncbi:3-phosphoserine/phosphohydroxythreonine transaminase [Magnetofaba australis]|nr:3-phosphoserine/phosphohydroxythreonine transaminase [Magnetofaba australis]